VVELLLFLDGEVAGIRRDGLETLELETRGRDELDVTVGHGRSSPEEGRERE
jgi:hypothetical protein